MKMIHVNFVADKVNESEIRDEELDELLDEIIGLIEEHGMLMGGGAHDYGDPNSAKCKHCGAYEAAEAERKARSAVREDPPIT